MGFGVLRIDGDGAPEVSHRFFDLPTRTQGHAEIEMGVGVVRIQLHRPSQLTDRLVESRAKDRATMHG